MAIFTPGPVVASISGSVGGTTFSHNRGGRYMRNRSIPVASTTTYAMNVKALMAARSQAWQSLTTAQRAAWLAFAQQTPVLNALGNAFTRSGHQAYVAINFRLALNSFALITAPPIVAAQPALLTYTQTYDIGAGVESATYTATPLGATSYLWIRAALVDSAGKTYIKNLLKFIGLSAAAQASPFSIESLVNTRLGTQTVGQTLHTEISVFDSATGLLSPARPARGVIIST